MDLQTLISDFNLKKMAVMNQMQNEENPDEEKLKMEFDYQQFKKEIEEQLKKMKHE